MINSMIQLLDELDILISVDESLALLQEIVVNAAASGKFGIDDEAIRDNFKSEELDPLNWDIVKIEEIAEFTNGYAFKSSDYRDDGIGIIRMSDLKHGEISVRQLKYVSNSFLSELSSALQVKPNDLVIGMSGSIGRPCFNRTEKTFLLNQRVGKLTPNLDLVTPEFLAISLASMEQYFLQISMGSAIKNLSTAQIKQAKILLPPIAIQKIIVSHYEEFLSLLKRLKASLSSDKEVALNFRNSVIDAVSIAQSSEDLQIAWQRIQQNWDVITGTPEAIDSMKTLILDLAVRGDLITVDSPKVVESIEWTNSELKLDDSKVWSLPTLRKERITGWNRIPLAKLGFWGSGGTPTSSRKDYYQNGTIPWAVIGDLNNDIMTRTEASITEKALAESSSKLVPKGAILIAMYGASIGKTAITGIECCTNQAIAHCIVDTKLVSKDYFFIVAKSLKRHLIQEGKGAAQPNISQSVLKHLIIDLPPLAEQALIVERVEALMQLCDRLNFSLRESEFLAEKFARSVVSASA
jgi:type I restriction enzyme S subunit